ncbi:MAG: alkaline phosphatase D family protein [Candidatus Zixiibacteriota bacterium]
MNGRLARSAALIGIALVVTTNVASAATQFLWSGAVTPSSARVKARISPDGAVARLIVSASTDFSDPMYSSPDTALTAVNNRVVDLPITGLSPDTRYRYALEVDGNLDTSLTGWFRTFPDSPTSFTIALGSCAQTASAHTVFTTIKDHDPLLFLHTGDFHYENIGVNDPNVFRAAYESVLASATQSALYRSVPIAYIWDDHDYGPNNSDSTAPGRTASRLTYQEYVPYYPLPAGTGDVPIYQAFDIGRVRFILTDSRSARSPYTATDNAAKTMLGATQKAWFKQELLNSRDTYPLIVWVNTLPWIGTTGDDGWYLYTTERREIADFLKDNGISNICMLSGDAHMIAIDDGTNSDYATGGGAGFPVFHAAALDRSGSTKGGPYSEGAYPGGGRFGLMTVSDSGGAWLHVLWQGLTYTNSQLVSYSFSVPTGTIVPCDCASHGDIAGDDGAIDNLDLAALIDHVFFGDAQPVTDFTCPHVDRGDIDCDGFDDATDLAHLIDIIYFGGPGPCDPCACTVYPVDCP